MFLTIKITVPGGLAVLCLLKGGGLELLIELVSLWGVSTRISMSSGRGGEAFWGEPGETLFFSEDPQQPILVQNVKTISRTMQQNENFCETFAAANVEDFVSV